MNGRTFLHVRAPENERAVSLAEAVRAASDRLLGGEGQVTIAGLKGAARALAVARCGLRLRRPLLVVTSGAAAAEAFAADLQLFLDEVDPADPLQGRVRLYPAWDTPPLEPLSPTPGVCAQRAAALFRLRHDAHAIVVTTADALAQRTSPVAGFDRGCLSLGVGESARLESVCDHLSEWGYRRVPQVDERGEYSIHGGILDVFAPDYSFPRRLEFVGDRVESIREFDPASQRSRPVAEAESRVVLLPLREFSVAEAGEGAVRRRIEERCEELGVPRRGRRELIEAVNTGVFLPGVERLLPLVHPDAATLGDFLGAGTVVVYDDPGAVRQSAERFAETVAGTSERLGSEQKFFPSPAALYLTAAHVWRGLERFPRVNLDPLVAGEGGLHVACQLEGDLAWEVRALRGRAPSLAPLARQVRQWMDGGAQVLLVAGRSPNAERLRGLLELHGVDLPVAVETLAERMDRAGGSAIVVGGLSRGFRLPGDGLALLGEVEIFGERRRRAPSARRASHLLSSLAQLRPGDCVVHVDYGVGRYHGLRHLRVADREGDYLHLEYSGGDRLYVPVDRINLVQRYVGAEQSAPSLDRLGSGSWEKVKRRTRASVLAMARELLELSAAREVMEGHPVGSPDGYYREFETRFPFDETPDQHAAIEDVLADMRRAKPMDRLVCGDVGYGKTEVAMRAAFVAAMDGWQVAVLAPTTVLAQQHLETFRARFAGYPVRIEMVSRFRSAAENRRVLAELGRGTVDIVIGTHRLLQRDVGFRRLGLLVIDEEHRFGVADKEKIKKLRRLVHVVTLTATPIPRTLHMALSGIRDLSVIETPPPDRRAIRTYVCRYDEEVIREAVLREVARGGQVFFVHNRVQTIDREARRLRELLPGVRCGIAHGQMAERDLERVMIAFLAREIQLLICSAIVESGLDISNANTILIDRADTFGLADLYQLRGRVGRSNQRAYAYLLIPGEHLITREAQKRLQVLQELDDLGGGFRLAVHDLEIRGAGNLLGRQQSGHIAAVGFELYTQMLEEAVRELRGETVTREVEPEVRIGAPAFLPEEYVPDVHQRLMLYKRMAGARTGEEIGELAEELRDRYGPLPPVVDRLLRVMDVRRVLRSLGVTRATIRPAAVQIEFSAARPEVAERLQALARDPERRVEVRPPARLRVVPRATEWGGVLDELSGLLRELGGSLS